MITANSFLDNRPVLFKILVIVLSRLLVNLFDLTSSECNLCLKQSVCFGLVNKHFGAFVSTAYFII